MRKQNKKSKKQNMDINYLDLIPVRSEELHWHKDIKGTCDTGCGEYGTVQ